MAAAGGAGGDKVYVEDVFSTFLYAGDSSAGLRTIDNGLNLLDEGGLIWTKERNNQASHFLIDTERGLSGGYLKSNDSDGANTSRVSESIDSFTTTGYKLDGGGTVWNRDSFNAVSWSFRKQPGFFDIQTYTGNNSGQTLTHDLGCVPAMIWIKRTDFGEDWVVYHVGSDSSAPEDYSLKLNETEARSNNNGAFNDTAPTSTQFTVGNSGAVSQGGKSFVAYLFAGTNDSDSQIFGDDSDESIIKCGSYTGNGNATGPLIDLGFEPQFVMIKAASRTGHWFMLDVMRGIITGSSSSSPGTNEYILANSDGAEGTTTSINVNSTGFQPRTTDDSVNENNATYTYMAIRRPMKTPEAGTEVFSPVTSTGTGSARTLSGTFPTDLTFMHQREATDDGRTFAWDRLRGKSSMLQLTNTSAEAGITGVGFDVQNGLDLTDSGFSNYNTAPYITYLFKRATGFFDMVVATPSGYAWSNVPHNLGVTPELLIYKPRATGSWYVMSSALAASTNYLTLDSNSAVTVSNASQYSASATTVSFPSMPSNASTVAYLFATVAGVSKVGSVTHSGTTDVDCGFSAGARFVLIKRTDASGDWFIWDSVRGIVSGNDPYFRPNVDGAEVTNTDYIDPLSSGFTLTSSFTAGTYIFLAIA